MRIPSLVLTLCILLTGVLAAQAQWPGRFQKAWVCGRLTVAGKPVAGVQVMAMGDAGMAMTRTAANGNYSLGVGEGDWTVTATYQGHGVDRRAEVSLKAGEANEKIDLSLTPLPHVIRGRVVDEQGRTLSHASVVATPFMDFTEEEPTEPEGMDLPLSVVADEKGHFILPVPQGVFLLMANRTNYEMSPKNPPVRIPGLPEGMAPQMPGLLARAPGDEVVIILRPTSGKLPHEEGSEILPQPLVAAGRACLTPGNVLHWTRTKERKEAAGFVVKRCTTPFDGKGQVVEITAAQEFFGVMSDPGDEGSVYSITDTTAVPGTTYWYAVQELGTKGAGPLSNVVQLTTR